MQVVSEVQKDLVFVGGGHAHALALRMLAMEGIAGLQITLISPASHTPYSGMLPGLVAGHYSFEETHIDLARLCQWAGVRFICAAVTHIDPKAQTLSLQGRPAISYDVLSLDVGSQPELDSVPGARDFSVPVKPVASLWRRWQSLREKLESSPQGEKHRVAMVGGGAGSVELIAAMAECFSRLEKNQRTGDSSAGGVSFDLFCGSSSILREYNARARQAVTKALQHYGVVVHLNSRVQRVQKNSLSIVNGTTHGFDELFWCTGAAAAPWIAESGLETDSRGFLAIRNTLQSLRYDNIFAAGDCATQVDHPRPKAGVYAVRQAPVLAENLRNSVLGLTLKDHLPQQHFLSLISLGEMRATADRGPLSATGAWVWRWKDKIDREFMSRFENLPTLMAGNAAHSLTEEAELGGQLPCGGCGAKVGADNLSNVLQELAREFPVCCPAGDGSDDVVQIPNAQNSPIVQSIDTLRQIVADPWIMGRIAANHALSDLYASGATPISALASISLEFSAPAILQRELKLILAGALHEFSAVDCQLLGGHTMQGPELNVGFVVNGLLAQGGDGLLAKCGLRQGDHLVLTKAIGTGTLFASHMQLRADGRNIQTAIDSMLQSNAAAGQLALKYDATACTDITGFGLLGHLGEMLESGCAAELFLSKIPVLPGALDSILGGTHSTMHEANKRAVGELAVIKSAELGGLDLLFDPQTSGGLLIGVSADASARLCEELVAAGYTSAVVIGEIRSTTEDRNTITIN